MSRKRQKGKPEKANAEDETSKNTVPTPDEKLSAQTFDEYQCSGNVEVDFPLLCALLDMKDIPTVSTKQPASLTTETEGGDTEDSPSHINAAPSWPKPCLQVELENEDPLSAKNLKLSGWKVDERIARVLQKMLLSLSQLQSLYFWQAGLTDQMLISLMNPISLCSNLRAVTLEGNHLPERSYQLLLSEDSVLAHLSLRNNQMGAEGARVIGSALSTTRSANRNLLSLNLAFNAIGDAGATHIAQGLRLNRALLFLSLSNNQIGDSGAAHLSAILCEFALTHEEVVERRKMLLSAQHGESVEIVNPLLDQSVQHRDGELILPGNTTLSSLNLAGNRITEKSLPLFLTSLEMQDEGGGLLRLCLERNRFPPECECYVKIKELMTLADPLKETQL